MSHVLLSICQKHLTHKHSMTGGACFSLPAYMSPLHLHPRQYLEICSHGWGDRCCLHLQNSKCCVHAQVRVILARQSPSNAPCCILSCTCPVPQHSLSACQQPVSCHRAQRLGMPLNPRKLVWCCLHSTFHSSYPPLSHCLSIKHRTSGS